MNELDWLIGYRFQSLVRREYDWVLVFDQDASITITCLWRLCENGRIRRTSEDHGHQFGLSSPVDAAAQVNRLLAAETVKAISLNKNTLDLELHFQSDYLFQIIPISAGYEAWTLTGPGKNIIAIGGGELATFSQ